MANERIKTITITSKEGQDVIFNKSFLIRESKYFQALFQSGMKESTAERMRLPLASTVSLKYIQSLGIERDAVELSLDDTEDLLQLCEYLQMESILNQCQKILMNSITFSNIQFLWDLSLKYHLTELLSCIVKFTGDKAEDFIKSADFLELDLEKACDILYQDNLDVSSEYDVLSTALHWIIQNKDTCEVEKILQCVRFDQLEITLNKKLCPDYFEFINGLFQNTNLNLEQIVCIKERINHVVAKCLNGKPTKGRCMQSCVMMCGGFVGYDTCTETVQMIATEDLEKSIGDNQKVILQPARYCNLKQPLCEHQACTIGDFLYIAGGQYEYSENGNYTTNKVHRLDLRRRDKFEQFKWEEVCDMMNRRSLFFMGSIDGHLYSVCGWHKPNMVHKSVESYDPEINKWVEEPSMTIGLHEHAGCILKKTIYISGGYKPPITGHLNLVWRWTVGTKEWVAAPSMIHARSYHIMCAVSEDQIAVAGGVQCIDGESFNNVLVCEMYDLKTEQWTELTTLEKYASCMSHLLYNDKLTIWGGHSFEGNHPYHRQLQVYDFVKKTWIYRKPISTLEYRTPKHYVMHYTCTPVKLSTRYLKMMHRNI